MTVVSVVHCQVEVSASGRSLVQRSQKKCGASKYHRDVPYGEAMTPDRFEQPREKNKTWNGG